MYALGSGNDLLPSEAEKANTMKKHYLSFLLLFGMLDLIAQCDGTRYREFMFDGFNVLSEVTYGSNLLYDGNVEDLQMDIYLPDGDVSTDRALVIVAHGGFFVSGSKTGTDVVPLCQNLARMGYVAVSIEYRLGFGLAADLAGPMTEAVMRGVQDGKAAVRFLRKSVDEGNPYGIDPNEVYFAGSSAGGYIALHMAYLDEEEEIPTWVNQSSPGLEGGLEGISGSAGYSSSVNAIVNLAGAIGDTAWIHTGDEPALLFHGTNDATVPFGSDMQYAFGLVPVLEVDGSSSVAERLSEKGVEHCFEIYEGLGHVPHATNDAVFDTTLSIISNFLSYQICGGELDCEYRELEVGVEEEFDLAGDVVIYPNPATDRLAVQERGVMLMTLYDGMGRVVREVRGGSVMEVGDLVRGVYVIVVVGDGWIRRGGVVLG